MDRSSPKHKFFFKRRDFFLFLVLLSGIAVLFAYRSRPVRVTISGLGLDDTRTSVASHLRLQDYRSSRSGEWQEIWDRMGSADIDIIYDRSDSVYRLEGGTPEIDGLDATHWTPEDFRAALGPPSRIGRARNVGQKGIEWSSFPRQQLIIYHERSGARFLLFESANNS